MYSSFIQTKEGIELEFKGSKGGVCVCVITRQSIKKGTKHLCVYTNHRGWRGEGGKILVHTNTCHIRYT